MKVINSSGQAIGLLVREGESLKQKTLMADDYIVVDRLTSQMYNLADPVRKLLTVKEDKEDE